MFVAYFEFDEFLEVLRTRQLFRPEVHVTSLSRTIPIDGLDTARTSVVASWADGEDLHICHLPVEMAWLVQREEPDRQLRQALRVRADQARELVVAQIAGAGHQVRPGLALIPGAWADVQKLEASQGLWSWTGDQRDPLKRQLVPLVEVSDG